MQPAPRHDPPGTIEHEFKQTRDLITDEANFTRMQLQEIKNEILLSNTISVIFLAGMILFYFWWFA